MSSKCPVSHLNSDIVWLPVINCYLSVMPTTLLGPYRAEAIEHIMFVS